MSADLEAGRLKESESSDDRLERPEEPSTSTWRGRTASTVCPILSSIVTLAQGVFATYYFVDGNNVLGGIFVTLGVFACCPTSAFWRYYFKAEWNANAATFEDQLRSQKGTQQLLREDVSRYGTDINRLTGERQAFEKLAEVLKKEKKEVITREKAAISELKEVKGELAKLVALKDQFEANTRKVQVALESVKSDNQELDNKIDVMRTVVGTLEHFPEALAKKVQELNLEGDSLKQDVEGLRTIVTQFKQCVLKLADEYAKTKAERNDFKKKVEQLGRERKALQKTLDQYESLIVRLEEILQRYEGVVPELKKIKELAPLFSKRTESSHSKHSGKGDKKIKRKSSHSEKNGQKYHHRKEKESLAPFDEAGAVKETLIGVVGGEDPDDRKGGGAD